MTFWQPTHMGIDRRQFLGGAVMIGLSAGPVGKALAQTPKRGGHLIVGMPAASTADVLDPSVYRADFALAMGAQLYDHLAALDVNSQVHPWLAESWEPNATADAWVIKLRKGVMFHNGKEMTSRDVVYSFDRHRSKESRSSIKVFAIRMTEVKATGTYEVTFKLDSPDVDFPYTLTLLQFMILPEGGTNEGVGTGAFKIESFEPGLRGRTTRNTNDWAPDRGFVESIETIAINDPTARLNALLSGAVHLIERISPAAAVALRGNTDIQIFTSPSFGRNAFDMMVDTAPFDSPDVRLALKYAIDREAILKVQLRGLGVLGNDHPISPLDPYCARDIPQRAYDPDRARFLIKKSGFEGPIVLSAADAAFSGALDSAQMFQAAAKKAGIELRVNRVPDDGYYAQVFGKHSFVADYNGGRPAPSLMFSHAYHSDSTSNATHWRNPKFDQMLVAARAEFDVAKRKQILHDMQVMLHEEGGAIIPVFVNSLDAGSKKVKGFVPYPLWEMSGFRAFERVWLES